MFGVIIIIVTDIIFMWEAALLGCVNGGAKFYDIMKQQFMITLSSSFLL